MSKTVSFDRQVMIRLTTAQARALEELASAEGLPLSSLARSGLIKHFNLPRGETDGLVSEQEPSKTGAPA